MPVVIVVRSCRWKLPGPAAPDHRGASCSLQALPAAMAAVVDPAGWGRFRSWPGFCTGVLASLSRSLWSWVLDQGAGTVEKSPLVTLQVADLSV